MEALLLYMSGTQYGNSFFGFLLVQFSYWILLNNLLQMVNIVVCPVINLYKCLYCKHFTALLTSLYSVDRIFDRVFRCVYLCVRVFGCVCLYFFGLFTTLISLLYNSLLHVAGSECEQKKINWEYNACNIQKTKWAGSRAVNGRLEHEQKTKSHHIFACNKKKSRSSGLGVKRRWAF